MTLEDQKLLRLLSKTKAEIVTDGTARTCPAYPGGDRRKRAACWIERTRVEALTRHGLLTPFEKGLRVTDKAEHRYAPLTKRRAKPSVIEDLTRARAGQRAYLSAREARAARTFASDYARAHYGIAATQNYGGSGVFTPRSAETQQNRMITRVDAMTRVNNALQMLTDAETSLLRAVLVQELSLSDCETRENQVPGSAKKILKRALSKLVRHYASVKD